MKTVESFAFDIKTGLNNYYAGTLTRKATPPPIFFYSKEGLIFLQKTFFG